MAGKQAATRLINGQREPKSDEAAADEAAGLEEPDKAGRPALAERDQNLCGAVEELTQRMQQTIDQAQAFIAARRTGHSAADAASHPSRERRKPGSTGNGQARGSPSRSAVLADSSELIKRSAWLHEQAKAAIEAFAASEDETARIHEELALRHPQHADGYRNAAQRATEAAHRAREILQRSPDGQSTLGTETIALRT